MGGSVGDPVGDSVGGAVGEPVAAWVAPISAVYSRRFGDPAPSLEIMSLVESAINSA